ncbi:MAG: monovalent cation/H+ antiporter subunit D [Smithellaceae bacterium]|nr:monovalent cation/H+ antiporter subunit D [Syntrophaceae bacterium]MDD4241784.1 monovalent cation/H+ antiporter subunit D [Smithellaceae bacterium]NLX50559.1 monovalent cation/H+ antiporter subunit D [Deltaproteobacteria bacterium]
MTHLPILPLLIPLFAGALLTMLPPKALALRRSVSLVAVLLQIPLAALLIVRAGAELSVYALGNWPAPFGIVLVVDRLAAILLFTTAILASAALLYALRGDDEQGRGFHALFQFQLLGVNGAFLTGDLFNLFVFFEILLIASYALLLHGRTAERIRAGLHYVLINIVGSSLFLISLGALYALCGTLNMADLARRVAGLSAANAPLVAAAGSLLMVVFGLKAAAFPLYFWLPRAYSSAAAPVAAVFAVLTKVGLYAILRVNLLIFGREAGDLAYLANDWLWAAALLTIAAGAIGVLAADTLGRLIAYLVVVSAGTIAAGVALGSREAITATLYYLIHSTWIAGAFFLLSGELARRRGDNIADRLVPGPPLLRLLLPGGLFLAAAVSVAGLPPLSGFLGKLLLLSSAPAGAETFWLYGAVLGGGLPVLIALGRAGSTLLWRCDAALAPAAGPDAARMAAVMILLIAGALLVVFAEPVCVYLDAASGQLLNPEDTISRVLSGPPAGIGGPR